MELRAAGCTPRSPDPARLAITDALADGERLAVGRGRDAGHAVQPVAHHLLVPQSGVAW